MTATLKRALAAGINHIETAQGYGPSEMFLGQAIADLGVRSQLTLTTKLTPGLSPAEVTAKIHRSLAQLQVDHLDCLAIHGLNTWEHLAWVQDPDSGMAAVHQAQADGKIQHIGFSTHGPLDLILAAIDTEQFAFINLHYSYFFQRNAPAIDRATKQDLGIFIISPGDKGGQLYTPPQTLLDLCAPHPPLNLTYRWLLSNPRITTLSLGPANPTELEWPLQVCDRTDPLTPSETQALNRLQQTATQTLGSDQCHQCYQCLPCPETIHIPEVLRLRNLAIAYDMENFGQYRYRMFENAGHWFPGRRGNHCTNCGDCLPRCPHQLDIPTLLKDAHNRLSGPAKRRLWQ